MSLDGSRLSFFIDLGLGLATLLEVKQESDHIVPHILRTVTRSTLTTPPTLPINLNPTKMIRRR